MEKNLITLENIFIWIAFLCYLFGAFVYIFSITLKRESTKLGTGFLIVGACAHFISTVFRTIVAQRLPLSNMYESMSLFALTTVLIYLYVENRYKLKILGIFAAPVAFLIMAYASVLPKEVEPLVPALQSHWLKIHVITCFIGYSAFAVAFATSLMYTCKNSNNLQPIFATILPLGITIELAVLKTHDFSFSGVLNSKTDYITFVFILLIMMIAVLGQIIPSFKQNWGRSMIANFPSLERLDLISYKLTTLGFPFLTIGIISGAIWAEYAWGTYWSWDPKETWSLITWLIYAAYLHMRFVHGWKGKTTAIINVVGFLCVIFTYIGVNYLLAGLHSYA